MERCTHFVVRGGPTVVRVSREFDAAVAAEIRAEVARQGLARTAVGKAAGVDAKSWTRYFVNTERDIPLQVLSRVCDILGVRVSDIIERAESHVVPADELMERLSPADRRAVAKTQTRARAAHDLQA